MALFGPVRQQAASSNLVEFRAGKLSYNPQDNKVNPDKRKGLVYMYQSDDTLMHFCWKDRTTGTLDDDFIIFPEDAQFLRVKQCNTGRVFLLKMKQTGIRHFFWMQEPKTDKDDEFFNKVNDLLNNGPSAVSAAASGGAESSERTPGGSSALGRGLGALGEGLSPEQLALMQQMFGGAGLSDAAGELNPESLDGLSGLDQQQFWQLVNLMGGGSRGGAGSGRPVLGRGGGGSGTGTTSAGGLFGSGGETSETLSSGSTASTARQTDGESSNATSGAAPAAASASTTDASGNVRRVHLSDLQTILAGMNLPANQAGNDQEIQSNVDVLRQESEAAASAAKAGDEAASEKPPPSSSSSSSTAQSSSAPGRATGAGGTDNKKDDKEKEKDSSSSTGDKKNQLEDEEMELD